MSFAIIKTGGKQYKVRAGEILKVERLDENRQAQKLSLKMFLLMEMIRLLKLDPQK